MTREIRRISFITLLCLGLVAFFLLGSGYVSERIYHATRDAEHHLDVQAQRITAWLTTTTEQAQEFLEVVAMHPVLLENPSAVLHLLDAVWERSTSGIFQAIILLEEDGTVVAQVPIEPMIDLQILQGSVDPPQESESIPSFTGIGLDGRLSYALSASVGHEDTERKIIAFLDLYRISEIAFLIYDETQQITLTTETGEQFTLFPPSTLGAQKLSLVPRYIHKLVDARTTRQIKGTDVIDQNGWSISVSISYPLFLAQAVEDILNSYFFYAIQFLPVIFTLIVIVLLVNRSRNHFRQLATHDGLTGLLNHKHLHNELYSMIENRGESSISLILIDVDDFKLINDSRGHQAGDRILQRIAEVLLNQVRSQDFAARYGGEEFAVVLHDIDAKETLKVAERIRFTVKETSGVTISLGVSSLPEYASTAETLVKGADEALYLAKQRQKDQVCGVWELTEVTKY